jgi:hypothetical protein
MMRFLHRHEWMEDAACSEPGMDTALWTERETGTQWGAGEQATAIMVCRNCPVRRQCFDWIMTVEVGARKGEDRWGIFAGLTPQQRHGYATDARYKRRQPRLTADDVRAIRARHADGETAVDIAASLGLNASTVRKIVNRITWKDVA